MPIVLLVIFGATIALDFAAPWLTEKGVGSSVTNTFYGARIGSEQPAEWALAGGLFGVVFSLIWIVARRQFPDGRLHERAEAALLLMFLLPAYLLLQASGTAIGGSLTRNSAFADGAFSLTINGYLFLAASVAIVWLIGAALRSHLPREKIAFVLVVSGLGGTLAMELLPWSTTWGSGNSTRNVWRDAYGGLSPDPLGFLGGALFFALVIGILAWGWSLFVPEALARRYPLASLLAASAMLLAGLAATSVGRFIGAMLQQTFSSAPGSMISVAGIVFAAGVGWTIWTLFVSLQGRPREEEVVA